MVRPGNGRRPDSVADMLSRTLSPFRNLGGKLGSILLAVAVVLVLSSGVFVVGPGEQGVIRTFGKHTGRAGPGPHFRIPFVQDVDVVNVENIRRIEVGFRGDKQVASEALMLTGDENIVEAGMIIQYQVSDAAKYLFELRDPEESLRA